MQSDQRVASQRKVPLISSHPLLPRAGWLLPMCAAALLAVLVASRWSPAVGAVAGMGAWVLVLAGWKASQQPVTWLTGPGAQAAYAIVAAALLALLIRRMAREGLDRPGRARLRARATHRGGDGRH